MKILYAASDREGAQIQLLRLLQAAPNHSYRIAGYKSTLSKINLDWNLESLRDILDSSLINFDNETLNVYYEQVKSFNPDIIISDLEIYSSYVGNLLGKTVWQVSPNLLHYATPHKEKLAIGVFRSYPQLFNKSPRYEWTKNIIYNSDKKLVYSHFGDTGAFKPNEGFEWVRPYHVKGKVSRPCHHNVAGVCIRNNKKFINYVKRYSDAVLFSGFLEESYRGVILKSMSDLDEYQCNLKNCDSLLVQGHSDILADAYYNGKYSIILPNFNEQDCIVNSLYSKQFGLGTLIYDDSLVQPMDLNYDPIIDSNIKFLHQHLEAL